ncbi:histidine kinase dimerization/phospho-acceptor domain-containing protein [Thermodesulfobacteriota bacterium]
MMKDCRTNSPSEAKLSLNSKLLLIEVLVFFLPGMIIFYLYNEGHIFFDRSHLIILGAMLLMVLGGLVTIKQIFDRFLLLNNLIKNCSTDASPNHFHDIKDDTKELHEISQSFTNLMNKFNETSNELKDRVAEVAEIKQVEVTLQNAKREAEAVNTAKTHFLSNRCHELSAPLDSMITYARALLAANYGPLNKHQAEFANGILQKGDQLLGLINGIVDYAKMEDEKLVSDPA